MTPQENPTHGGATPGEPTLLSDIAGILEWSVSNFDQPCEEGCDNKQCQRLRRLRAAAVRLREEMERAAKRVQDRDLTRAMRYQAATDMDCLQRINGGPL